MVESLIVFTVCMVADIVLFWEMRSYAERRLADIHAEAVADVVDEYLIAAMKMQAELKHVAALRHDLRNHMQVVMDFCERGEREKAQEYMDAVSEEFGLEQVHVREA